MKQNIKRVLLLLCMVTCLFSLSACGKKDEGEALDPMQEATLKGAATDFLQNISAMSDEEVDAVIIATEKAKNTVALSGYQSWKAVKPEVGALVSIDSVVAEHADDGYRVELEATFEKRNMTFVTGIDEDVTQYTSFSFTPEYTIGEKMEKAGMNTLMGMGTVFVILIFISLLIGSFKFINQWENKIKKTEELRAAQPAASAPVPAVEEDLTDDMELVAVITAAIAASEGASADGLVVRSIRRAPAGNWKKA